jgi:hypothetical protein
MATLQGNRQASGDGAKASKLLRVLLAKGHGNNLEFAATVRARLIGGLKGATELRPVTQQPAGNIS